MSRLFGPIRQNGYVVRDIEAAMAHWIEVLQVGPWFYIDRVKTDWFRHRGQDSGREGLQHVAFWSTDYQSLYDRALAQGYRLGHEGQIGGEQGRFAYFDTGAPANAHAGTVIEISDISGNKGRFFEYVRERARTWDGSDPIRRLR